MFRRLSQSPLLRKFIASSVMFYALSGITSLANYLFYPIIARFVNVEQYGEIQFLVSMFGQLSVGFVVLNILAVIISVKKTDPTQQQRAIQALNQLAQLVAVVVCVGGVILLSTYHQHLSISSIWPIIWVGVGLLANVPLTIVIGRLQGGGRFVASGVLSLLSVLIKLFASILLTVLHQGSSGAIAGIAIGLLAAWLVGEWLLATPVHRPSIASIFSRKISFSELHFLKNAGFITLLAITSLTILSSADSITSRIVLNSFEAGQYAAVATITKTILALATPLMWLALPAAINHNIKKVRSLLVITFGICAIFGACIIILPAFFTKVLVGVNPAAFLSLTAPATISMVLYALSFVVVAAGVCIGHLRKVFSATIASAIMYGIMVLFFIQSQTPILASLIGQIASATTILALLLPSIAFRGSTSSMHGR